MNLKTIAKRTYSLIPFKKTVFDCVKLIWTPPQKLYRHLHFTGRIQIQIDPSHKLQMIHYGFELENELYWGGIQKWERVSLNLWVQLCRRAGNTAIFDIGANTGIYALIAKSINPGADVYAMEPVERVFDKLKANVSLNHFDITCLPVAASNYDGDAVIYDTNDPHTYSVTVNQNTMSGGGEAIETQITVQKLDSLIEEHKIDRISVMKIDVETHEAAVLEGFMQHLQQFRPAMLIEILNDDVGRNVEHIVSGLGYLYFNIDENNGIKQTQSITQSDYYNYLLCDRETAQYLKLI